MKERALGLLGKKVGMTAIFDENGKQIPVTVIEVGPCKVLAKRTESAHENGKSDGYYALQLGFDDKPERKVNKPDGGHFKKADTAGKRFVKEMRVSADVVGQYEVGQDITLDLLENEQFVDVVGLAKGRGYQGVMRRHNFAGFPKTHGTHEYQRHGGSIGSVTATRVNKGQKMAGQMGNNRVTVQNIKVIGMDKENNLLLINGSVPGSKRSYVMIYPALKKLMRAKNSKQSK